MDIMSPPLTPDTPSTSAQELNRARTPKHGLRPRPRLQEPTWTTTASEQDEDLSARKLSSEIAVMGAPTARAGSLRPAKPPRAPVQALSGGHGGSEQKLASKEGEKLILLLADKLARRFKGEWEGFNCIALDELCEASEPCWGSITRKVAIGGAATVRLCLEHKHLVELATGAPTSKDVVSEKTCEFKGCQEKHQLSLEIKGWTLSKEEVKYKYSLCPAPMLSLVDTREGSWNARDTQTSSLQYTIPRLEIARNQPIGRRSFLRMRARCVRRPVP